LLKGTQSFTGGSDRITYQIDLQEQSGPYAISARLLYQSVSYRFAMDLFAEDGTLAERVAGYYGSLDHTPTMVAQDQTSVP
jgi:hypothetical protein